MKITDITLEIRTEDGQSHLVVFDKWDFAPDGAVVLAGQLVREKWRAIFGDSSQLQDRYALSWIVVRWCVFTIMTLCEQPLSRILRTRRFASLTTIWV